MTERTSTYVTGVGIVVAVLTAIGAIAYVAKLGDERVERQRAADERDAYEGKCIERATLVATTAGSPNDATCRNKRHRMKVEPVTLAGEEIGALVKCECER